MIRKIMIITILVLFLSFVPYNSVLVPEWKVQVVDENRVPYTGREVRQFCNNYSLQISPCEDSHDNIRVTNENGFVVFPERKIRMSLFNRFFYSAKSLLEAIFLHGSLKNSVYLDTSGPEGYKTLEYTDEKLPPERFIVNSKSNM